MLDPDDFTLAVTDGGFARDLPTRWCFGERAFGGYTAALALAALLRSGPHRAAASLAVTFLEAGVAGPVEIVVEPLRAGRRAAVPRATVEQAGTPILTATAWLSEGWAAAPPPTAALSTLAVEHDAVADGPGAGTPLTWLSDHWPALTYAERIGVDYPTSWTGFARGRPEISLWARMVGPAAAAGDPLPYAQLADVLHLDGHLFDAPGQITGFDDADIVSLDLNIAWQPGSHLVPSTEWRLIDGRGSVAGAAATSLATVRSVRGALLAVGTSQGLVRR